MKIYGAGMAGLLAASMLRRHKPEVHEAQALLPNNHAALLRFRSAACSQATGIPFKRVEVLKAIWFQGQMHSQGDIRMNNMYAHKVTGAVTNRSIINLSPGERFIAPPDFIGQMAATADIRYGSKLEAAELLARTPESEPIISTIPVPMMMELTGWNEPLDFKWRTVWAVTADVSDCDVYQTVYYPEPILGHYRASLTGGLLTVEYTTAPKCVELDLADIMDGFGISCTVTNIRIKEQKYGKLTPLDNPAACRRFILYLTDRYRVYSLGRFATWRQLLLDDVVKDVQVIERLIEYRDTYQRALSNETTT
jgi:hypothetical protein